MASARTLLGPICPLPSLSASPASTRPCARTCGCSRCCLTPTAPCAHSWRRQARRVATAKAFRGEFHPVLLGAPHGLLGAILDDRAPLHLFALPRLLRKR